MANISKLDTSKGKITVNFPFINDDGSDSKYIISANQIGWAGGKLNDIEFDTTAELLTAIEDEINAIVTKVSSAVPTLTFTTFSNTLQWNTAVKIANINGTDIKVQLPANPNTDSQVDSVNDHYKAKEITTQALYKIKTDAAGHIISATKFDDFIEKSAVDNLKQQIADFKMYMLLLNASTTSSSSTTVTPGKGTNGSSEGTSGTQSVTATGTSTSVSPK